MVQKMQEKVYYLKYSAFHPFDAFYEIGFRGKGSVVMSLVLIVLFALMQCISTQYTGFVMNEAELASVNSVSIFCTWVLGIFLFAISNWSVTTLFNGKGNLLHILNVIAYSLTPIMLTQLIKVVVSNYVILEEAMILYVLVGIGIAWFVFMLISGLCVIHEYGLGKNLLSILFSFVAAAIIIFLGVLFFTLVEQMVMFIISVAEEFMRRI